MGTDLPRWRVREAAVLRLLGHLSFFESSSEKEARIPPNGHGGLLMSSWGWG